MPEWMKLIGAMLLLVLVVSASLWWGVWYWQHCAFVPVINAPAICFANSGSGR